MTSTKIFTIAQPALHNMVKAVCTNRKSVFDILNDIDEVTNIEFKDVLKYEKKKFNYINVLNLLDVLHVDDSFRVKLTRSCGKINILEIAVKTTNTKIKL